MSGDDALIIYDEAGVRHLRFNRPERLNALDLAQHDRVIRALGAAERDPTIRVVAFSGEGRAFCAGDDMKGGGEWPARYDGKRVDLDVGIGPLLLQEVTSKVRVFPKPVVALMHGYALGAGYDYATSCDFRVATDGCRFGDPRVHRAMWAAEGWSYKTPRLIPQTHVARIAYLGEALSGRDAYSIGLVHRLVRDSVDPREGARELLVALTALDPDTYAARKAELLMALDASYEQVLRTGI